jgi:protein transport protein SEC24
MQLKVLRFKSFLLVICCYANFCLSLVSAAYFSNLNANMLRLDHAQRPELNRGTVDFSVPEEYWAQHPPAKINPSYFSIDAPSTGFRTPQPMFYIFAFDVSKDAVETGFLETSCNLLKTVLYGGTSLDQEQLEPCFPPASQITILTYDDTIHFYDLKVRNPTSDAPPLIDRVLL